MKIVISLLLASMAAAAIAVTPTQEAAFIASYKKAFEARDIKALQAMLYTRGADPMALDFYKTMIVPEPGTKITSITLVDLSDEDVKRLASGKTPDGRPMITTLKPVKKLIVKTATKTKDMESTGTSSPYVGEFEGKLMIPVPGAGK